MTTRHKQGINTDTDIREKAIPILDEENKPEISATFEITAKELNILFEGKGCDIRVNKGEKITILKSYPRTYSLSGFPEGLTKAFDAHMGKNMSEARKLIKELLKQMDSTQFGTLIEESTESNLDNLQEFISEIEPSIQQLPDVELRKNEMNLLDQLRDIGIEITRVLSLKENFADEIKLLIPNFILFKPYKTLPNKVPISELDNVEFIADLAKASDFDPAIIKTGTDRKKRKHKRDVNIKFNKEYQEYWDQDETNVQVDWDSENVLFWIEENDIPYEPDIRSKGKQWYLAFYIKLTARSNEDKTNIILIDEPGLYLHATAQEDVLKKLKKTSKDSQIIFSTHSPYLIDTNNLDRIRLVIKEVDSGTGIKKITAKADKDTLAPIITAIGESLTLGIRTDKKNSIVSEGFSDYIYLSAFRELLGRTEDLHVVPSVGGDTAVYVGSVLFGWGVDPVFVLDNDRKGKRVKEKLKSNLGINEKRIIFAVDSDGEVEDILSKTDFRKFVLDDESVQYDSLNSEYVKSQDIEKILLARKFKEKVTEASIKLEDLDSDSRTRVEILFSKLTDVLSSEPIE